jgi:protocatechuate 4,5-dioxygenase alpha chain
MAWASHSYKDNLDTTVFNGRHSALGYPLNKMCMSFDEAENRDEFLQDMDAYCRKFGLSDEQREAVLAGDWLKLLKLGGRINTLAKVAIFHEQSTRDSDTDATDDKRGRKLRVV